MELFDIPVVLFIFRRKKVVDIIRRIGEIQPKKLYIIADQGRNEEEKIEVASCRAQVEAAINWDCEVIKNYAQENRGVYENIGEGAKWVLNREKWAIFLEDDNFPEISFFQFCKEMLIQYETDTRVLWVCGTNYLGDYQPKNQASYVFTRHMLPCGCASWSHKFNRFYNGNLSFCKDETIMERVGEVYCNRKVYRQYRTRWLSEYKLIEAGKKPISWDYQMDLSIKANNLFGICPCKNQIKNIGVDEYSIHGGKNFTNIMTKRFCGMDSYPLTFPLTHPTSLLVDPVFEEKIGKIILVPMRMKIRPFIVKCVRKILRIPDGVSIKTYKRKNKTYGKDSK